MKRVCGQILERCDGRILLKILEGFVYLGCFLAFAYYVTYFFDIYYTYPTTSVSQRKTYNELELPAITACNNNPFKRKLYCQRFPQDCFYLNCTDENVQQTMNDKCNLARKSKYFKFIRKDLPKEYELRRSSAIYNELRHDAHSHFLNCSYMKSGNYTNCDFNTVIHILVQDFRLNLRSCYRINAELYSSPDIQQNMSAADAFRKGLPVVKWSMDLQREEYYDVYANYSGFVDIHSPYYFTNPLTRGFDVKPGVTYMIFLDVYEVKMLPAPFHTNCTDYLEKWRNSGRQSWLTRKMCINECIHTFVLRKINCKLDDITFPGVAEPCYDENNILPTGLLYKGCTKNCSNECRSLSYKYKVKEMNDENKRSEDPNSDGLGIVHFEVYMSRPEYYTYRTLPKYQEVEWFSYVGNYIGIWIGTSVYTLGDVIRKVIRFLCAYRMKKIQNHTSKEKPRCIYVNSHM